MLIQMGEVNTRERSAKQRRKGHYGKRSSRRDQLE